MTSLVVTAPASDWMTTDGTLDNAHQNAIDAFETDIALVTRELRGKLTHQIPYVDGEWPAPDTSIAVTLEEQDWRALVGVLVQQAEWSGAWGDNEDAALLRTHIAAIRRVL